MYNTTPCYGFTTAKLIIFQNKLPTWYTKKATSQARAVVYTIVNIAQPQLASFLIAAITATQGK